MPHYPKSPLMGQMMSQPLLISNIVRHADRHYGHREIVSGRVEGDIHRYTYRDCHKRARQIANALTGLGIEAGDRVATLAWNGYRHLELYCAISGMGAVIHTANPRLHPDQVTYIVNHAEDQYLFFDMDLLPLVESISARCKTIKGFVMMCDADRMPRESTVPNLMCYEALVDANSDHYEWPLFDENSASCLCYTSGTTGSPKGVLYSHRSTVLHSYAGVMPDMFNISAREAVMPVVPMFHVNAWGLPYAALLAGAKLILPGPSLDGKSLYHLFEQEGVTSSAAVPTVWLGLLDYAQQNDLKFSSFKRAIIGGAACPPAMMRAFRDQYGVEAVHTWGMTEMSPIGTACTLQAHHMALPQEEKDAILARQGRVVFGVDMKIVDEQGQELPWDGQTSGNLEVKGPWVIHDYFKSDGSEALNEGWFRTGDIATITPDGYMKITDRSKDVIKSGGEWIGTLDLESIAMAHPAVQQAACVGIFHPKWDERPLLVVMKKQGAEVTREELIRFYDGKIAKWWVPDDVIFVEAMPIGATGKVKKNEIREQYRNYRLPMASHTSK